MKVTVLSLPQDEMTHKRKSREESPGKNNQGLGKNKTKLLRQKKCPEERRKTPNNKTKPHRRIHHLKGERVLYF